MEKDVFRQIVMEGFPMSITRRFAMALVLVALSGLVGTVAAQSTRIDTLNGIEISPGIVDVQKDTRFGAAFAGRASGDLPGFFAAAVNYMPASPGPGVTNSIIGGYWSLTVVRNGRIMGTLFGQVVAGTAVWDGEGKMAAVDLTLNIRGGTRSFFGANGPGLFSGVLDHTPLEVGRLPTIAGTMTLTF
jgi:hypothetical protein